MIDDAGQEIELGMWYRLLEEKQDLLAEVKRLRSGMQDILDDFETTKTDMWSIIKRIQELIE